MTVLTLSLSIGAEISFCQQTPFAPREDMMLFTMDKLQAGYDKDDAIREATIETQMKLAETGLPKKPQEKQGAGKSLKSRIHPYINSKISYDSNIDDAQYNAKGSMIFDTTPGVKMNFTGKSKALNLDTHINTEYFNNRSEYDGVDASAGYSGYMNIGKYILSSSDIYNNNYLSNISELGGRDEIYQREGILKRRWLNTFNLTLGRYFNRLGFDLGYRRQDIDYEPDFSIDEDKFVDTGILNSYLRVATKTRLIFGYAHSRTEYRKKYLIYNSDDFNLGLTGALSPKLTYLGRVDYFVNDSKPYNDSDNPAETDSRVLTLTGNLGYAFSNRTNITFNYNHGIKNFANDSFYSLEDTFKLTGNHRLAFNPKFNLSLLYEADLNDYPKHIGFAAHTDNYTLGCGLSYAFRQWLDFGLNWINVRVESDKETPYTKNVVEFKTQARF